MSTIITSKHPFITLSKEFSDLCRPLESIWITHFTYLKHFNDGSRVGLSNKPNWIDDYYNLHLYKSSLFEEHPSNYKDEFGVWLGESDLDVYQHGKNFYNTYHSITINQPVADGFEFFLFSTTQNRQKELLYIANNMDILFHFILFIKDRGEQLLNNCFKHKIHLPHSNDPINEKKLIDESKDFYQTMLNAKKSFFNSTPLHKFKLSNNTCDQKNKFSQRELLCLTYLLDNKTAYETSLELNISKRTVESYLDNIKNKLGVNKKSEILIKLSQFPLIRSSKNIRFQNNDSNEA